MDYKAEIRAHLAEVLEEKGDRAPFSDTCSLLNTGRIDSMDVVDLLLFFEKKFGVHIGSSQFKKGQLDTVEAMAALVHANLPVKQ
jgi:acyl carrier protein